MTVSPELFPTAVYTAPAGRDRESAPLDKARVQGSDSASAEKSRAGFKDHLAQTVDKKPAPDKKSSGKQISSPPAPQKKSETATVADSRDTAEAESDINTDINTGINSGINTEINTGTDISPDRTNQVFAETIGTTAPQATPEKQAAPNIMGQEIANQAEPETAVAPQDSPPGQGQGQEQTQGEKESAAQKSPTSPSSGPVDKASEQTPPTAKPPEVTLAENSRSSAPAQGSLPDPATDIRNHAAPLPQEVGQPQTTSGQSEAASASTNLETTGKSGSQEQEQTQVQTGRTTVDSEKGIPQPTSVNNAGTEGGMTPADEPQIAASAESLARQSEAPQQQMAAAIAQPALQKESETNRIVRDSDTKDADKKQAIAGARNKNQPTPSEKAKGFTQDSTGEKNAAAPDQSKSIPAAPQQILAAKTPFSNEFSQAMTGTEGKPASLINAPLPPGLLSVQDVGQGGLQANSLTATSQVKPAQPPVTPQMVSKQVTMAIMKQVGNGQQSFSIRLNPAELGQVDIRMEFQADGKMITTVTVDNERTLALLQKDQGSLEKALENSGFDVGSDNLNFSLKKQQNQGQNDFSENEQGEDGDSDPMSALPGSIMSHQQMKMAYSDNLLDINI